jgi:hypothetical protein
MSGVIYLFSMFYLAYLVTSKLGWMQAIVCTHNWYWIDVCWIIHILNNTEPAKGEFLVSWVIYETLKLKLGDGDAH